MDGYDMGFIVPQDDIEAFADRLSYLIENPDERQRMRDAAFKRSQDWMNRGRRNSSGRKKS